MTNLLNLIFIDNKIIPCMFLVFLLTIILANKIKTHPKVFYFVSAIISICFIFIYNYWTLKGFHPKFSYNIIKNLMAYVKKGIVGYCLFIIVMFLGVIKKKGNISKKLMSIRKELAIIASIFSFCHLLIYGFSFLFSLISGKAIDLGYIILFISSFVLFIILIPLFISSFKRIKNKMELAKWKKLQKYSYYFYFILFSNVIFVFIRRLIFNKEKVAAKPNGIEETWISLIVYTILFLTYTILRIKKNNQLKSNTKI